MSGSKAPTALVITNPLVKYRALVATKTIRPDPGQLRLAIRLQKLYGRLKDYEPRLEYGRRLDQISQSLRSAAKQAGARPTPTRSWRGLLASKETSESRALTRRLTSHESAIALDSPQGLMLHGDVGTGKSMLVDLFAECLPNRKKARWHFSTFMLHTFARLEAFRTAGLGKTTAAGGQSGGLDEYSLLWLAKEMVEQHPILFLDEFQMPDRVASKILSNLMITFFHLGGVLVATSNRMPEELMKASGLDFAPPSGRLESFGRRLGLSGNRSAISGNLFAQKDESGIFLEVLKARCEVWEINGGKDYRRAANPPNLGSGESEMNQSASTIDDQGDGEYPTYYQIRPNKELDPISVRQVIRQATGDLWATQASFLPCVMKIYGRKVQVPRQHRGVTDWTFQELCQTTLGPADYITLASTYHTLILHNVPVLTFVMKNEARRFITLLDALYECRCKLFIGAAAGPDHLFFPEPRRPKSGDHEEEETDAVYAETFSEAYQDATAPFRPNILSENPNYAELHSTPPDYTHARLVGLLNADAIEDDPPNRPPEKTTPPFRRSFGRSDAEMQRPPIDPDDPQHPALRPDFRRSARFTGDDERFAYKRAQSRLWEMCSARWWARREAGWHRPLPAHVRRWERGADEGVPPSTDSGPADNGTPSSDVRVGAAQWDSTREAHTFKPADGPSHSPFRTLREPPPKISWTHIWGAMKWGKKAGAWGQGPEGLKDRG